MENARAICYANLNSKNSSHEVTDEVMEQFFRKSYENGNNEIIQIVIDRCNTEIHYSKRKGWQHVLDICKDGTINTLIVPSFRMVAPQYGDLIDLIRELQKYSVNVWFIYEEISTEGKDATTLISFQAMVEEQYERLRYNEEKLRKQFESVTGCPAGLPSAKTVKIDDFLYKKANKVASIFGDEVEEMIESLLIFAINPQNEDRLAQMLGSREERKPKRRKTQSKESSQ